MKCECGRFIFPGETYGGSAEDGYTCSNCIKAVQVGLEQKAIRRLKREVVFIDGDFKTGKGNCEHHCSPTCRPAQVGPDWKYGCLHPDWPANKARCFCPIVNCGGLKEKCEMKGEQIDKS